MRSNTYIDTHNTHNNTHNSTNMMNQSFLEKHLKELEANPMYAFKILKKRIVNSFQHQLNFVIKTDPHKKTFQMLNKPAEVQQEVEKEYRNIFNNPTQYTEQIGNKWMQSMPKIPDTDQLGPFTSAEMLGVSKNTNPTSPKTSDGSSDSLRRCLRRTLRRYLRRSLRQQLHFGPNFIQNGPSIAKLLIKARM